MMRYCAQHQRAWSPPNHCPPTPYPGHWRAFAPWLLQYAQLFAAVGSIQIAVELTICDVCEEEGNAWSVWCWLLPSSATAVGCVGISSQPSGMAQA